MTLRLSQARASSLSRPARPPPRPKSKAPFHDSFLHWRSLGGSFLRWRSGDAPSRRPPLLHTQSCRGRARRGPLLRGVLAPHLPLLLVFPAATSSPAATSPPAGPPARRPAGSFPHRADFPPARLLASKLHPRDADRRTEQASVHPRDADRRIEQASVGSTEQPHFVSAAGLAGKLPPYAGCAGPPPQGAHYAGPPHVRGLVPGLIAAGRILRGHRMPISRRPRPTTRARRRRLETVGPGPPPPPEATTVEAAYGQPIPAVFTPPSWPTATAPPAVIARYLAA